MAKMIVFDMDGTIANLYGVAGWLHMLQAEDVTPYEIAEPLYNMKELSNILLDLKMLGGFRIAVTSWTSKGGSDEYNKAVAKAKKDWLDRFCFPYDELHLVEYGTSKSECTAYENDFQVLIDDNKKVRNSWVLGNTINAKEDILPFLERLVNAYI